MNPSLAQTEIGDESPAAARALGHWAVIDEVGLDYALPSDGADQQCLHMPSLAMRADDGTYLIVDELGTDKLVPFRFQCRTIRVDANRRVVYDTLEHGIDDGYGCLVDDGCMAILKRTKWELLIVALDGTIQDRFDLATFSKRTPRLVAGTPAGTFLVAFLNRAGELDLVEIDRRGRLLWFLPPGSHSIGVPASIQLLPGNTILVADPFRHVAVEFDREGNVVWQFGAPGYPSRLLRRLSNAGSVRGLPDGRRLISDTRNHRLLLVGVDGTVSVVRPAAEDLSDPVHSELLADGHYLVCDAGNQRVIELDTQGTIVWQYGQSVARKRFLSYPRSVELTGNDTYLVADTAHDRIVEMGGGHTRERPFQGTPTLFWPRCVRALPGGSLLIADARNRRIVEVSEEGDVLQELSKIELSGSTTLGDPHDVWILANGHLLISDSPRDLVMEVDWSGRVYRVIGGGRGVELDDPHSAQQLDNGQVVITDTGHHRVLIVDRDGNCVREIHALSTGSSWLRLSRPRYAEVISDGTMVIVDTDHNRILAATLEGKLIWELSQVPNSRLPRLKQPRWAKLINRYEVVICDHFHHRILHMKCSPPSNGVTDSCS